MGVSRGILFIFLFICACGGHKTQISTVPQTPYKKGIDALARKDYLTAEKELKQAIEENNRHVAAYCALGEIYLNWSRLDEAQANFEKALKIDPNFVDAFVGLAKLEHKKDNNKKALEFLMESLQITKNNAEVHYLLGLIYLKENNDTLAIEEFKKTLDINPHHVLAQLKLKQAQSQGQQIPDDEINLSHKENVTRTEIAHFLVNNLNLKARRIAQQILIEDIKNDREEEEIQLLVNLQIMKVTDHKFYPNKLVTRAELAQMGQALIILSTGDQSLKSAFSQISSLFSDVYPTDPYYNAVILATSYGLLETSGDGKFHPSSYVNGKEVVQFIDKIRQYIFW